MDKLLRTDIIHDIYVIATQECVRSIASSLFMPSKNEWELLVQKMLGPNYVMVRGHAMQALHLIIFINIRLTPLLSNV